MKGHWHPYRGPGPVNNGRNYFEDGNFYDAGFSTVKVVMAMNGGATSQAEMAQQVLSYLVAAGRWRGQQRTGWRNNDELHDELIDALEELPEDLQDQLQKPLQRQLLELHRTQEDVEWAVGPTAATVALQDLLRAVVEGGSSSRWWGRCAARRCPGGDGGAAGREVPGRPLWGQGPAGMGSAWN